MLFRSSRNVVISGPEIQLMQFLHHHVAKISTNKISENTGLSSELVTFMLARLKKQKLVKQASPEWVLTSKGRQIVKQVNGIYPKLEKIVEHDPYFSDLNKRSGKGLIYK